MGTSDLAWCEAIMAEGHSGEDRLDGVAKRRYPFAVDTALRSGHIDFETGAVW